MHFLGLNGKINLNITNLLRGTKDMFEQTAEQLLIKTEEQVIILE